MAEKEKPASSSALPVVESPSMAQPAKRRRIAIKSDLTKHLFDMSIGVTERPLAFEAPSSHTAANVKKWWSSLKVKNMEGLQSVQSRADTILAGLSLEERTGLRDRACSLGLPVSVAMKLKDLERLRVVLSALYMLDYCCPTVSTSFEFDDIHIFGPWISALMAIIQACYLHQVDFSLRLPCRAMVAYLSVFLLFHNFGYYSQVKT